MTWTVGLQLSRPQDQVIAVLYTLVTLQRVASWQA